MCSIIVFFFKQKTAYKMRIRDWSSDVCSSDLREAQTLRRLGSVPLGTGVSGLLAALCARAATTQRCAEDSPRSRLARRLGKRVATQRRPDIRDAIGVPVALAIGIAGVDPTIPAGAGAVGSELCARLAPRRQAGRCLAIEPRARPNPGLHQCRPTPRRLADALW